MDFEKMFFGIIGFYYFKKFKENIFKGEINVIYMYVLEVFRMWSIICILLFIF